eukprot:5454273-Prymnesium_polylepis.2
MENTSGFRMACAHTSMQPTQNVAQHTRDTTKIWSWKSPLPWRSRNEFSELLPKPSFLSIVQHSDCRRARTRG